MYQQKLLLITVRHNGRQKEKKEKRPVVVVNNDDDDDDGAEGSIEQAFRLFSFFVCVEEEGLTFLFTFFFIISH